MDTIRLEEGKSVRLPSFIEDQIDELVDKMHKEGKVIHGDLYFDNIVICPTTRVDTVPPLRTFRGKCKVIDDADRPFDLQAIIDHYTLILNEPINLGDDPKRYDKEFYKLFLIKYLDHWRGGV